MRRGPGKRMAQIAALAAVTLLLRPAIVRGQESYTIGAGDVLEITVWEHPELSGSATVDRAGTITLPPIGEVRAAGRTARELARHLEEILQSFLRERVQATVSVAEYNSRRVHVTGDVAAPGRYGFPEIPSLLEVLGVAGGPTPTADLTRVRLLRPAVRDTVVITVDLDQVLQTGNLQILPELQPGDVIFIPTRIEAGQAVLPGEEGVAFVLGAVGRPGPVRVGQGLALTRVLSMVGGTSPGARIGEVRLLVPGAQGASPWVLETDLESILETGDPGPQVRAGELVYVPPGKEGTVALALGALYELGRFSRDVVNLLIIGDFLRDN